MEPARGNAPSRGRRRATRGAVLAAIAAAAWSGGVPAWITAAAPSLSPFVVAGSAVASRAAGWTALWCLPALALALLVTMGFCRHACPLGLLFGLVRRARPRGLRLQVDLPPLGRWALLATLGGAALGYPLFLWMDPMAVTQAGLNALRPPWTAAALLAGLGLPLLLVSEWLFPHLWCRRLCPLGALQRAPLRLKHAAAARRASAPAGTAAPDLGRLARRGFAVALAGAAAAALARRVRGADAPIRPPGAAAADCFAGLCIRCGNCARVCPARIIRPDLLEAGFTGLLAPTLRFDDDFCRADCRRCTEVCPSGALTRLELAAKKRWKLGLAKVDMDTCLLAEGRECTACLRACPYEAIALASRDGGFETEPEVNAGRCNGCGACEAACPVRPARAIRVSGAVPGWPS